MAACALQGRFIVDADVVRPGRTFWSDELFDIVQNIGGTRGDGPFYNVPGFPDNFKVDAATGLPSVKLFSVWKQQGVAVTSASAELTSALLQCTGFVCTTHSLITGLS